MEQVPVARVPVREEDLAVGEVERVALAWVPEDNAYAPPAELKQIIS